MSKGGNSMTQKRAFHALINHHIEKRGLLQNYIAKKLHLSTTFLSRWKTDRFPKFETLLKFSALLQLSRDEEKELISQYVTGRAHKEVKKAMNYLDAKKHNPYSGKIKAW